jgi:hypothetical protein
MTTAVHPDIAAIDATLDRLHEERVQARQDFVAYVVTGIVFREGRQSRRADLEHLSHEHCTILICRWCGTKTAVPGKLRHTWAKQHSLCGGRA